MKKMLIVALTLVFAIAFTACDDGGNGCTKGTDGCDCTADGTCNAGLVCGADNKCAVQQGDCCPDNPPPSNVSISGMVNTFPQGAAQCALAPIMPGQFLTLQPGGTLTHLAEGTSDASGIFAFDCFDVSNVSLGMIMLADDAGFDGTGGNFYPTVSGLASWPADADKDCITEALAFVMPNTLLTALSAMGLDADTNGFIFGMVLDASRSPMAGAKVLNGADGTEVTGVLYLNETLDGVGTETASHGIYLVPGPFSFGALMGEKTGYTWSADMFKAATVPGYGYFVPLVANE